MEPEAKEPASSYVFCSVSAQRYDEGMTIDFNPTQDADILFPSSPGIVPLASPPRVRDVTIHRRSGLRPATHYRVTEAFWAFSLTWFESGAAGDEVSEAEAASSALEAGHARLGPVLAREATGRWADYEARDPSAHSQAVVLSFACILELLPRGEEAPELAFVRGVGPGAVQQALRELARP